MPSRSLDDLHPSVKPMAQAFLAACADAGIEILVTSQTASITGK